MRIFQSITDAQLEIKRDLFKAPKLQSTRVQHIDDDRVMAEATNYSYAVMAAGIPVTARELVSTIAAYNDYWAEHKEELQDFLSTELEQRVGGPQARYPAEYKHPELANMAEGNHYGYLYSERLFGFTQHIPALLNQFEESRRAFWPVFHPIDAIRSAAMTRIPCTIGYQWLIRPDPTGMSDTPLLECTLLSRSCDFERFWASDLWFAAALTRKLAEELQVPTTMGNVSHFVVSFHRFLDGEEIY